MELSNDSRTSISSNATTYTTYNSNRSKHRPPKLYQATMPSAKSEADCKAVSPAAKGVPAKKSWHSMVLEETLHGQTVRLPCRHALWAQPGDGDRSPAFLRMVAFPAIRVHSKLAAACPAHLESLMKVTRRRQEKPQGARGPRGPPSADQEYQSLKEVIIITSYVYILCLFLCNGQARAPHRQPRSELASYLGKS